MAALRSRASAPDAMVPKSRPTTLRQTQSEPTCIGQLLDRMSSQYLAHHGDDSDDDSDDGSAWD